MSGLDRGLVEHRLPMIPGKKPVKQSSRRFAPEVCIDDIIVGSKKKEDHLRHLKLSFERMRKHGLKMNPLKCAFGVTAGEFLGFVIHQKGIEVNRNKTKAIMETKPPSNKKELQSLLGKVNFLRRFISNLSSKTKVFSPLLRLKKEQEF
uniref:Retrotransposable element Tf2 n=1 Tax=Cajanus cajan TaxID=3821 RepID=A0A151U3Z2_CAJCA|nr:Retrotransposable element Tf2 [Cajanus cajan]